MEASFNEMCRILNSEMEMPALINWSSDHIALATSLVSEAGFARVLCRYVEYCPVSLICRPVVRSLHGKVLSTFAGVHSEYKVVFQ